MAPLLYWPSDEFRFCKRYYNKLCQTIISLVDKSLRRLAEKRATVIASNWPGLKPPAAIRLSDPRLHIATNRDPLWLIGGNNCGETFELASIVHECLSVLYQQPLWQDVEAETAFWLATTIGDPSLLIACLQTATCDMGIVLSKIMLSSLLHEAITSKTVDMVKVLLANGADPSHQLYFSNVLLTPLDELLSSVMQKPHNFDETQKNILKLLADSGADFLCANTKTGLIPLHYTLNIAFKSEEAAAIVVKSTPPAGYSYLYRSLAAKFSPIAMSFQQLFTTTGLGNSQQEVNRIATSVILPMVRGGATFVPDFFVDSSKIQQFYRFCLRQVLPMTARFWINLLIEARRSGYFPASKNNESGMNEIRSKFPLPLASLCRQCITRQLKVGESKRLTAIHALQLPECLSAYLNYSEFDSQSF